MLRMKFFNMSITLFVAVLFMLVNTLPAAQQEQDWLDNPVTVRFQDESLNKVLGKISKQTDIAILYDQELAGKEVSGNYKDVKISEAINRLFSGKNKSIQVFKGEKKIIVKTFGAKHFVLAGEGGVEKTQAQGQEGSEQMTLAELEKMHRQQYKEYKERIADKNEVLEGGMTRGELKVMHAQQYEKYKERLANDNEVLEGGMTRGELKVMHAQQYEKYKERLANNEVLEGGSMTRREVRAMHEKQYETYKKERLADDSEVLDGGGMTRAELRALHKKQSCGAGFYSVRENCESVKR